VTHSNNASNWVDRGEPADGKVRQIVAHFLGEPDAAKAAAPWLDDVARDIIGMASADAGEVQIAGYLRQLETTRGRDGTGVAPARIVAIAIWHVVKAAEVRDRAERTARARAHMRPTESQPLGDWLAERLLSPDELLQHRQQRDVGDADA
jgi:hypothetical protein